MYELTVELQFSSAHSLRGYEGACENLHGHNWKVEVTVESAGLDNLGMVMDFKRIKSEAKKVIDALDHRFLNEVPPFDTINPTAENIAASIYAGIGTSLNGGGVRVSRVKVWESDTSAASYKD
ncbi:MAG: 6-carboxytetrahydropterin synthase QueD [Deltaproteobacteria bacterium]